jgi:nickel/cobalt exporter
MNRTLLGSLASLCLCATAVSSASAHPVPSENHDRSILVRLTPTAVVVEYRLEVDESRAGLDLPKAEIAKIKSRDDLHSTFCRYFADVLAGNLVAELDGTPLEFRSVSHRFTLRDELNRPLGHLRCEYRMEAAWHPTADTPHRFAFRESNYELEDFNRLHLSFATGEGVDAQNVSAPDAALLVRKPADFQPGDAERLRKAACTFRLIPVAPRGIDKPALPPDFADLKSEPEDAAASAKPLTPEFLPAEAKPWQEGGEEAPAEDAWSLLNLLLDTKQGLAVLLLLAAAFGAIHALTPGHGKTLVAAYLVGERGTVWHALLLGVVTTATHTAAVIAVAIVLLFIAPEYQGAILFLLEFGGGLAVVGLGLWLLYARLSGRADHVHLGGGHHDHDHPHDHAEEWAALAKSKPGVGALLVLGISGGIVPCWDAIAVLAFAISAGRFWLGLPLILAFSVGLAGTLTAIGVGVVQARKFADNRWKDSDRFRRLVRALPLVSAAVVTLLGFWLCYASLHPH